jgi:hypothetical protein
VLTNQLALIETTQLWSGVCRPPPLLGRIVRSSNYVPRANNEDEPTGHRAVRLSGLTGLLGMGAAQTFFVGLPGSVM